MSGDREKWERDRQHEEHLQKVAERSLCAFPVNGGVLCQKPLGVAWLGGQHHLRCGAGHIDPPVDRLKSYTELWLKGEYIPPEIAEKIRKKWRKQMEEKGLTPVQIDVLEKARRAPIASLSDRQVLTLAEVVWPDAPDEARRRAALICQQYGLNPMLNQIALIKFKTKEGDKWEPVLAIEATRIIAQNAMHGARPNYLDDTPRIMTDEEQRLHNGEVDEVNWWALTKVADHAGSTAIGVGNWAKKPYKDNYGNTQGEVYGASKGNTAQNMAKIRSERQALKRLCPAELPAEIEVIDAEFIELAMPQEAPKQRALPPRAEPRPAGIPTNLVMKTPMDLFGASKRYFNLSQPQVLADLNLTNVTDLADVGDAWATIVALHTGPPEGA